MLVSQHANASTETNCSKGDTTSASICWVVIQPKISSPISCNQQLSSHHAADAVYRGTCALAVLLYVAAAADADAAAMLGSLGMNPG